MLSEENDLLLERQRGLNQELVDIKSELDDSKREGATTSVKLNLSIGTNFKVE